MRRVNKLGAAAILLAIGGCSSAPTKPLANVDFYAPQRQDDPILSGPQAKKLAEPMPARAVKTAATAPTPVIVASTAPATTQSDSTGQFMTLGGIVAVVDGKPIYASRILTEIRSALKANAAEMDRADYEDAAKSLIDKQIHDDRQSEILIAQASRKLDEKDKKLADQLTEKWRRDQITQAGGSVELARRSSAEIARRYNLELTGPFIPPLPEDLDFEQMVQEVHWRSMVELYLYRRVYSRVDVSAAEMRDYYRRNLDKQFTEHARVRFRLIEIDPEQAGGRDAAITKVGDLLRRALAGEDFARLARENCTDPSLAKSAGDVGWIDRGSFRLEKVEKAVWDTPVGEIVKDPIEDNGVYYIAKVESRSGGSVRPFDETKTQEAIKRVLTLSQEQTLAPSLDEDMIKIFDDQDLKDGGNQQAVNTALEIAMQLYAVWHREKAQPAVSRANVGQVSP